MLLSEIRERDIERAFDEAENTCGAATLQQMRARLHSIFTLALRDRLVTVNPVSAVQRATKSRKPRKDQGLSDDQVRALLDAARGTRAEAYIVLALGTGARPSEIAALRWRDIDFERNRVRIEATLGKLAVGGPLVRTVPKTTAPRRTVPVEPDVLNPLLQKMRGEPRPDTLIFKTYSGEPMSRWHIAKFVVAPIAKAAGLPTVTPYTFRHAFTTMLARRGVPPTVVAALLGHTTTRMVLDVYTHSTSEMEVEAVGRLKGMFA